VQEKDMDMDIVRRHLVLKEEKDEEELKSTVDEEEEELDAEGFLVFNSKVIWIWIKYYFIIIF
jgi:hypothetical protein